MHTHTPRWPFVSTLVLLICPAAFAQTGEIALLAPVQVVVDMDPARPGIQSNVNVLPADVIELKVSVYVFHPSGTARIWSIGYFGGLDRGIAFGHVPTNTSRGGVRKIEGALGTPVHPDGHGWIANAPFLDPLFAGPEIQYLELPATESPEAASISTGPFRAVFHAGIQIGGAQSGDVYHFFLGDRVAAWMPDQGSFSAAGLMTLDTGGDSIPDRTATLFGTDADKSVPVPPGAFLVDFVDGDGGATVTVLDCSDLTNVSVPACDGVCGGLEGIGCPDGEFCRTAPGECCCDFFGECQPIPDLCIALYDPVCGCDGRTYSNACEAATAGVAVDHRGACEKICGGPDGIACDDGEFCRRPEGVCALDRSFGVCESFPPGCPDHVDPVCGCDGVNYGNPCEAAAVGMSIAHRGECLEVCGGFAGFPCPEGQFCKTAPGECCCDFFGKCTEFSESCKDVFDPVCGCDGRTYKNPCEADRVGVSVDHRGTCEKICGGLLGLRCEEGQFCLFRDGQCNVADNTGVCEIFPPNCTEEYAPVCGCDNKTYDNRCFARAAGVSVDHVGPCGQECGGPLTVVCPDGEFCMFREGACGPSDGTGECRTIPPVCTDEWDPVCGCDSKTYGNACEAAAAGVSISHRGACGEVCGGLAGIACTDGEFCKLPDGECCCDIQGECMTIPNECPAIIEPVCGCDHRTYVNECVASSKGVSIKHRGHCRFFDAVVLFDCWSGPGVPASPECLDYDLDGDGDVDLTDFGQYLRKYSGG